MRFDPDQVLAPHEEFVVTRRALVPAIRGFVTVRSALARPYDWVGGALILAGILMRRVADEVSGQPIGDIVTRRGWKRDVDTHQMVFLGLPESDPEQVAYWCRVTEARPDLLPKLHVNMQAAIANARLHE